jgi:hypothetical protein
MGDAVKPTSLREFTGPSKPSGTQIQFKFCPVCGGDQWKTFVDPDTGKWICFRGSCGARGQVEIGLDAEPKAAGQDILDTLEQSFRKAGLVQEWEEIDLPPWHELTFPARKYLRKRGIDDDMADGLGLVEWEDKSRILIPFFDRAGSLIYWNSRRYSDQLGEGPKYLTAPGKHPLYTQRGSLGKDEVVVVEGVFDAFAVLRAGWDVVAMGGKSLPSYLVKDLLTFAAGRGMIIGLDSDALDASLRLRSQLSDRAEVRIVTPPHGLDPGDMIPGKIEEMLCT